MQLQNDMPVPLFRQLDPADEEVPDEREANLTFNPVLLKRMYTQQDSQHATQHSLEAEHARLSKELMTMSQMLTELIDQKHQCLTEFQSVLKQKRAYHRLLLHLQEQYQGFSFMLSMDYETALAEDALKTKNNLLMLKREIKEIKKELDSPFPSNLQQLKTYDMERSVVRYLSTISKKTAAFEQNMTAITQKNQQTKRIEKEIYMMEAALSEEDDYYRVDKRAVQEEYQQLSIKLARLKKIRESTAAQKVSQLFQKSAAITQIQQRIKQATLAIDQRDLAIGKSRKQIQQMQNSRDLRIETVQTSKASQVSTIQSIGKHTLSRVEAPPQIYRELAKNSYFKSIINSRCNTESSIVAMEPTVLERRQRTLANIEESRRTPWTGQSRGRDSSGYDEVCASMNKRRLLIEEDCEYEMQDLIYNRHYQ